MPSRGELLGRQKEDPQNQNKNPAISVETITAKIRTNALLEKLRARVVVKMAT